MDRSSAARGRRQSPRVAILGAGAGGLCLAIGGLRWLVWAMLTEAGRALAKTTWAAGCGSWYKTNSGKITNNGSGFTLDYWRRTRRPDRSAFRTGARGAA